MTDGTLVTSHFQLLTSQLLNFIDDLPNVVENGADFSLEFAKFNYYGSFSWQVKPPQWSFASLIPY